MTIKGTIIPKAVTWVDRLFWGYVLTPSSAATPALRVSPSEFPWPPQSA